MHVCDRTLSGLGGIGKGGVGVGVHQDVFNPCEHGHPALFSKVGNGHNRVIDAKHSLDHDVDAVCLHETQGVFCVLQAQRIQCANDIDNNLHGPRGRSLCIFIEKRKH